MDIPKFESELEEAKWWFVNQDDILRELQSAAIEGRLGRRTIADRMEEADRIKRSL